MAWTHFAKLHNCLSYPAHITPLGLGPYPDHNEKDHHKIVCFARGYSARSEVLILGPVGVLASELQASQAGFLPE